MTMAPEKTFENRPSNPYANSPRFKKKNWEWPSGVEGWRAFFQGRKLHFSRSEPYCSRARTALGVRALPTSKAANAFLADRAPRVDLRGTVCDAGPPAVVNAEPLAWRAAMSGKTWGRR